MRITKYFLLIFTILFSSFNSIFSQNSEVSKSGSVKVLLAGNSFTGWHDMPTMFTELSKAGNKDVYVDKHLQYGRSLFEISSSTVFREKLKSENWDYLILQDSPYRYAYLNEFDVNFPVRQALNIISYQAKLNYEETKIVLFMPWAYKDGKFWVEDSDDYFEMQDKVYENTIMIADNSDFLVSPIGWAWKKVIIEDSTIVLFEEDLTHPTMEGAYLNACVIYSTIHQEEIKDNTFKSTVSDNVADYLQQTASTVALEEIERKYLTGVAISPNNRFELHQNFPNPFNPQTTISFYLNKNDYVKLEIYNSLGERIDELINGELSSGEHSVTFNADKLVSGIYYYRIKTNNYMVTKSMVLLK